MSGYVDRLREHSFDGIQEFDNYLPKWWLWSFYLACIYAAIYWFHYEGSGFGTSSIAAYEAEYSAKMKREAAAKPVTRQLLLDYAKQPSAIEAGRKLFVTTCFVCHKADGGGQAGPNLTDKFWIHGGSIEQIYQTVAKGSPTDATMIAWEPNLKRVGVLQVVSYVMSIKNTNVPGGKAPQGKAEN
jgi:cytochrome c oxidase cbb3-type subunit III